MSQHSQRLCFAISMLLFLMGCAASPTPTPTPAPLPKELAFYDWPDDIPQAVLDAFQKEYGVHITYNSYASQDEAITSLRAGQAGDVIVLENEFVPVATGEGLLAEIDYTRVPNFKNISPNFRDLVYDPGNRHVIPFNWGTTGIVSRSDLVTGTISSWKDLWDEQYAGKVIISSEPRYAIGIALKSLGYSINSEDPIQVNAATARLIELKPRLNLIADDEVQAAPALTSGKAVIGSGYAGTVLRARQDTPAIAYVIPKEGTLLWGDNFAIPLRSAHKEAAELLLNFLLRPEITAQIVNANYYATPNDAARPLLLPEILQDPVIFPPEQDLAKAEIVLPLSPAGKKLYADAWGRFMSAQ
ncbi:MAG: spermidine/putrescine ABC transporter substrate-binding protein [Anaerolineae bacterium]